LGMARSKRLAAKLHRARGVRMGYIQQEGNPFQSRTARFITVRRAARLEVAATFESLEMDGRLMLRMLS
jgi:hypothetical protein